MDTVWLRHDSSLAHDIPGHPERPERIRALEAAMARADWFGASLLEAPAAARAQLLAVHPESYVAGR
ncbi:MAG TPA: histone deacetylase, partial [Solirubrobacteraceae bacterium]|nr:histone deacetylase [Solirubrobacteraceae bacterium]